MTDLPLYPMRLTAPSGKRVRVLSKEEHDKLLEEWTAPEPPHIEAVSAALTGLPPADPVKVAQ